MKETIKNILFILLLSLLVYFCLVFPSETGLAVRQSADRCLNVIIPSMFVFICLTSSAVSTGVHSIISIPFILPARYIFRLKPQHFGIFLLSLFSGYPAGIKLLTDSFRKNEITRKEFDRLSCFCFAGGPAFISGTVSGVLYPETQAGLICFISVTAGNILTAFLTGLFSPFPEKTTYKFRTNITSESLTGAVLSSARAMFQMCSMIIFFSAMYRAAELSGAVFTASDGLSRITGLTPYHAQAVLSSFFEISNIVNMPKGCTGLLPVAAFLLSFGGICVFVQVVALSDGLLNTGKFLISRLFSAAVSFCVCRLIMPFFDLGSAEVFAPAYHTQNNTSLLLLLIMTVMLLSLSKNNRHSCKNVL